MVIGLKRGRVELADHNPEWKTIAQETIGLLQRVFGPVVKDIQHVGSTAIYSIKAKPIIDIAIAVEDFGEVDLLMPKLNEVGFFKSRLHAVKDDMLICDNDEYADTRSYHIHVVKVGSIQWRNYLNFRDYLNVKSDVAKEYEQVKMNLSKDYQSDRNAYTDGKDAIITRLLSESQTWACLHDIPRYNTFSKIEPITKGMSGDIKYNIKTNDGKQYLLRVADVDAYERKKSEFEVMKQVAASGVPMQQPVDLGVCNNGKCVYTLLTWIDGVEVETKLLNLTKKEQYTLGLQAGAILRRIHTIPAPKGTADWSERYFTVMDDRLDAFRTEGILFEGSDVVLYFLNNNRHLLKNRPQCRHHGDYHDGNLICNDNGELFVIDWHTIDFDNIGDPWYEISNCVSDNPYYATGQIQGYFDGEPPQTFWELFLYYTAAAAITSIVWAKYFSRGRLDEILNLNANVLRWFDNRQNPVPTWYLKDFYVQYIDGVPLKLKKPFDLDFIHSYGKVFKVFDDQDSGNLCFGVRAGDGKQYFVKFAGASTEQYKGVIADAIDRLKATVPVYRDLAHPALIKFVEADDVGGGFAMVFEWIDAICAQRMYPSDYKAFRELSLETKRHIFEDIMEFHVHVAAKGYVAIDFYDGSIMWDMENERR